MAFVFLTLFYIFFPLVLLYLSHKYAIVNKIGAILLAYAFGLVLGNLGILPEGSDKIQNMLTTITVPLAIPLLLFSTNIKVWFKMAGKTLASMLIALVSVILVVFIGYIIFSGNGIKDLWKVGGLLVGLYSGGTPNLASLKLVLNVDPDVFVITHSFDMLISAIYLLFLISIGQKVFHLILPKYKSINGANRNEKNTFENDYWGFWQKPYRMSVLKGLGLSILIFAIGGSLTFIVPEKAEMAVVILTITTLAILSSLIKGVNKLDKTFDLGMYFILVFSLVIASMADINTFKGTAPDLLMYISFVIFGSLLVHVLFSRIFKIDADTVMITSTALICSPPFVPVIAGAIKNREIIVTGLTVGIIGYAIGNYLGFIVAEILKII